MKTRVSEYINCADTKLAVKVGNWRLLFIGNTQGEPEGVIFPDQVHGGNLVRVSKKRKVKADGLFVTEPNVGVGVYTADCLPMVVLADDRAAVLHLSRKSLASGLLDKVRDYVPPNKIRHVYIGPHICQDHLYYDKSSRDSEVYRFERMFPEAVRKRSGVWFLSIRQVVQGYLDDWRVMDQIVTEDRRCTFENEKLSSRRRTEKQVGYYQPKRQNLTIVWRSPGKQKYSL